MTFTHGNPHRFKKGAAHQIHGKKAKAKHAAPPMRKGSPFAKGGPVDGAINDLTTPQDAAAPAMPPEPMEEE